jgi:hypothetical protein
MIVQGTYQDIHGQTRRVYQRHPNGFYFSGLAQELWIGNESRPESVIISGEAPGILRASETQWILPDFGGFLIRGVYLRLKRNQIIWGSQCVYQALMGSDVYLITPYGPQESQKAA